MTNIVLPPVTNGNNISTLNDNFRKIQESVNNDLLNLDGGNNVMQQDLDMNSNLLLNVGVDVNNPDSLLTVSTADARYYNVSGDTLTGPMSVNNNVISGLRAPVGPTEPVRKQELDAALFDSATELAANLANSTDPAKGASLVGFDGLPLSEYIEDVVNTHTNTAIDIKSGVANAGIYAQLVRLVGDSTNREIQSFAVSPASGFIYSTHHRVADDFGILTRYPIGNSVVKTQVDSTTADVRVGHQGLSIERTDSADKIWITYGVSPASAMRCDYVAGGTVANAEIYQLFDYPRFNTTSSCNPSVSPDQRFLSGFCLEMGTGKIFFRLWNFKDVLAAGPGNHTNSWIQEWEVTGVYIPGVYPVQGHAITGNEVYFWAGGNGVSPSIGDRHLHCFTLTGKKLADNLIANVGRAEAAGDGSGVSYEPEGMQVVDIPGHGPSLCLGVRSGSNLDPSVFRIWALGLSQTVQASTNNSTSLIVNRQNSGRNITVTRAGVEIGGVSQNTAALSLLAGEGLILRFGNLASGVETSRVEIDASGNVRPFVSGVPSVGLSSRQWANVFSVIGTYTGPVQLGKFTLTTLPSAATFNGFLIDVTNATGGPKTCRSNGTVWQILNTTTTVS